MNSGIYKLSFKSGMFYIGKSIDIPVRWRQHYDKLCKGTGAVRLQQQFNIYRDYNQEVLFPCHSDHLDLIETYCLNHLDRTFMLNTTFPTPLSEEEYEPVLANEDLLQYSTPMLIKTLAEQAAIIKRLKSGY